MFQDVSNIHPASRGVAAHTAGLFRSVRGAKGGVEYEEQSGTGELTYITAGFVDLFLSGLKICSCRMNWTCQQHPAQKSRTRGANQEALTESKK